MPKMLKSLTNQILFATVLGIVCGLILHDKIAFIKVIGDVFLRLIQMSVVILIMGAVIEAVGSLEAKVLGKIGLKVMLWFIGSTILAAAIGVVVGLIVQPGADVTIANVELDSIATSSGTLSEMILEFFPSNIVEAMANANMIQVIVFALLFGLALSLADRKKTQPILDFVASFNHVILKMVTLVMKLAPIGIFCLVAPMVGSVGIEILLTLTKFLLTLGASSLIFMLIWLMLTAVYCKVPFKQLCQKMWRMSVVAFTTTSSAVTLPIQIEDSEEKLGISDRISKLVMPLGMTLNSNGLALFLSISIITFAQFYGIELALPDLIQAVILSTLACLGTVVVPGGGLVALATVMPMLGLPTESIAILAGIDWFSGMFRTLLNVDADTTVALIIAKDEGELDYSKYQ
ncbi:dicarboxylate/amino acid:cation symporter [Enterococcus sp. LJL120]